MLKSTLASGLSAIATMFLRFSNGKVYDLLLEWVRRRYAAGSDITHLTRSKSDTLFPTGLSTEFPSGVNTMLPCL